MKRKYFYLSLKVLFDQITKCIPLLDIPQKFFNMLESRKILTVGQKIKKSPDQKNSRNQINNFFEYIHEN